MSHLCGVLRLDYKRATNRHLTQAAFVCQASEAKGGDNAKQGWTPGTGARCPSGCLSLPVPPASSPLGKPGSHILQTPQPPGHWHVPPSAICCREGAGVAKLRCCGRKPRSGAPPACPPACAFQPSPAHCLTAPHPTFPVLPTLPPLPAQGCGILAFPPQQCCCCAGVRSDYMALPLQLVETINPMSATTNSTHIENSVLCPTLCTIPPHCVPPLQPLPWSPPHPASERGSLRGRGQGQHHSGEKFREKTLPFLPSSASTALCDLSLNCLFKYITEVGRAGHEGVSSKRHNL